MSKVVKGIIFVVLGSIVLVVALPLLGGIFSSVKPGKAVQMAQQKTAENVAVYVPTGFTISKKAEPRESDYGTLFVTEMTGAGKKIQIIESDATVLPCKGMNKEIDGMNVCYYGMGKVTSNPKSRLFMWTRGKKNFQLETDAETVSDEELSKIVTSL